MFVTTMMRSLFGRESELHLLDRLLDDIHGGGGSLAVTGGPGVGKSALLVEAAARAAQRRMLVLQATGVQSEALLAFAGLHQLRRPVLSRLDRLAARNATRYERRSAWPTGPRQICS